MRPLPLPVFLIFASVMAAGPARTAQSMTYAPDAAPVLAAGAVAVDTRALEACAAKSIAGARCLPSTAFLGPHRRLADFREILWLLGAAGLDGGEHVLVVGDAPQARDFVAGVLYLAGQKRVSILTRSLSQGAGLPADALGPGSERSMTREKVFQAPLRDGLIVLRGELAGHIGDGAPGLLDGRSEKEYWGETVRGPRGGHVPGAQHLPAAGLRAGLAAGNALVPRNPDPIAYGHDPVEGIAYFTLLTAGAGVAARVYIGGWAEWAAHTALPADSVTYPDRAPGNQAAPAAGRQAKAPTASRVAHAWPWLAAAALLGAAVTAGAFYLGRRSAS